MKKFRLTPTRSQLLKLFKSTSIPISAEQILRKIKVNKTTVYRQLESLANQGLIKPVVFSDRTTRYESSELSHHHHLICTRCNRITDIIIPENIETKAKSVAIETKFRIQSHSLEFFGLCKNCQ